MQQIILNKNFKDLFIGKSSLFIFPIPLIKNFSFADISLTES